MGAFLNCSKHRDYAWHRNYAISDLKKGVRGVGGKYNKLLIREV